MDAQHDSSTKRWLEKLEDDRSASEKKITAASGSIVLDLAVLRNANSQTRTALQRVLEQWETDSFRRCEERTMASGGGTGAVCFWVLVVLGGWRGGGGGDGVKTGGGGVVKMRSY